MVWVHGGLLDGDKQLIRRLAGGRVSHCSETKDATTKHCKSGGKGRTSLVGLARHCGLAACRGVAGALLETPGLNPGQARSGRAPCAALRRSWELARLIFFAAGATPYTLAVGRGDAGSEASDVSQVAPSFAEGDLARLELAQVGPLHDQVVAAPSVSDARLLASAARTRTVILWAVLIIGVLAVLLMTRQLMQQMRQPAPADDAGGDTA
ncbi:MAG: DUF3999 family protein [Massilia sp.]